MELRRELILTIGILVLLNLLLAFGSIGLFVRMGPVIERILQENVYSIVATEEMLTVLAEFGGEPLSRDARSRLGASLQKAKQNVTENDEEEVLKSIERHLFAAMDGDSQARKRVIGELGRLIRINRDAMRRVDEKARRLGSAGAWAAVFIGFLSFILSLFVVVRFQTRFVRPLVNLYEVLIGVHQGDRLRRCHVEEAPREVMQVVRSVNELLDERMQHND
jgi:methyl-accepting chemotaxis protein